MRTYWQMRMDHARLGPSAFLRGLGDDPSQMDPGQQEVFQETGIYPDQQMAVDTANQLSQYANSEILQAFNTVLSTLQSEQQDLQQMQQWLADNGDTLTPDGKQLYQQALNQETDVVKNLQDWVSKFSAALQALGLNSSGLSGYRRRLGAWPVVLGLAAIIAIVIGAGVWKYYQAQSDQAHADAEKAKTMTQVQANVPALLQQLLKAGVPYDEAWKRVTNYVKQQQDANKQPFDLAKFPWATIAVVTGAVLVAKSIFE